MKRICIFCALIFSLALAKGQYVLIPDSNFRHALINQGFASCFDISQTMLDTTCSAVLDSTLINVANKNIRSIEGIQYFKQLHSFACDSNPLYVLPSLPNTVSYLSCQYDSLISLTALPTSLYLFYCFHNQLDSLPALPNSLRWLEIQDNSISKLPAIPTSVYSLLCAYNNLDSLPLLPSHLGVLDCSNNPIIIFPSLPASLITLYCNSLNLDTLPSLPDSIVNLNCTNNQLTSLPLLPNTIKQFRCSYNQLTSIPPLPDSMTIFDCSFNPNLICLPQLKRIVNFNFDGTGVTCLPDITFSITNSTPSVVGLPLCASNGCFPLGISDLNDRMLKVYPNPVSDILYIDCSMQNATITITDVTGQICATSVTGSQIDVSALRSGMYLCTIQNVTRTVVTKFIKE